MGGSQHWPALMKGMNVDEKTAKKINSGNHRSNRNAIRPSRSRQAVLERMVERQRVDHEANANIATFYRFLWEDPDDPEPPSDKPLRRRATSKRPDPISKWLRERPDILKKLRDELWKDGFRAGYSDCYGRYGPGPGRKVIYDHSP